MSEIILLLGFVVVAVLGVLGFGEKKRRDGAQDARDKANADTLKRVEKGRRAVNRDGTPDERLRRNDGDWN